MTTNRTFSRSRLWLAVVVAATVALAAVAVWVLVLVPADVAQLAPPTTAALTPATSRPEAANLTTTTTTPPTTATATTTATTTTPPATTTTTTLPTTATAAVPVVADDVDDQSPHIHEGELHTHDHAAPPTWVVDTSGTGCPYGTYTDRHRVPDQCVLDRLQEIFSAVLAGTHAERMAAIRDGQDLAPVLAGLEAYMDELSPNPHIWRDADLRTWVTVEVKGAMWQGPDRLGVRWRVTLEDLDPVVERWYLTPAVWVDGQWWISREAFCRVVGSMGGASQICPDDPRPGIPSEMAIRAGGIAVYDPEDLPGEERIKVNSGADIW